jgi:hypothetical protein
MLRLIETPSIKSNRLDKSATNLVFKLLARSGDTDEGSPL